MFNIPKIDFTNPAKLSGSGEIFAGAGFGKSTGFRLEPEPKSGTALVQSPFMTLDQETKWAYATTIPSPWGRCKQTTCRLTDFTVGWLGLSVCAKSAFTE